MYKTLVSISFSLALCISNTLMAFNTSQEDQIEIAKSNFQNLVKNQPDKEIRATAYLVNEIALSNVRDLIKESNVSVAGFRHGNQSYSGGYGIRLGESLEEAMVNYQRKHELILTKKAELDQMNVPTEGDDNLKIAMQMYTNTAKYRLEDFKKHGLRIIGIDLTGRVSSIKNFMDNQPIVRLIEVRTGHDRLPFIVPSMK